jgi:hypothetical protein
MDATADIRSDLQRLAEGLQRGDATNQTIRDNMSALIALITLINERIIQSLREIEKNSRNDDDHREKHTEIQALITKAITDLNIVALELKQHSADAIRIERRTEKYDVQVQEILALLSKLGPQIQGIHDVLMAIEMRSEISGEGRPAADDTGTEARKMRWNFWTVIIAALITSGAIWKIVDIIAAAIKSGGKG